VIPSTQPSSQPSESPSANPSQGCDNIRTDCGWGIFNPWTCQCDCPVGICRDNNGYCLNPCQDTINVNPFAGCVPGWDCPWHPSNDGYCKSEMHIPNEFMIYRSAKDCCQEHYGGSAQCVTDSKNLGAKSRSSEFPNTSNYYAPVEADNIWQTEQGQAPRWFPDLYNKQNCVYGSNYESWMNEGDFKESYLSKTSARCCDSWYPTKGSDCPDPGSAVNPEAEDEALSPGGAVAYFFPEFDKNNCGFGVDYPAWMGVNGYEKHYLFASGQECCDRYFKGVGGCPHETTHDGGYFWSQYEDELPNDQAMPAVYNHTYYPLLERGTCVNGTDYPDWMAIDDDYRRMYLFKDLEGCCQQWFSDFDVQGCVGSVVQGFYDYVPCVENRDDSGCVETSSITNTTAHQLAMFYPRLGSNTCGNDGDMPSWMLSEDYAEYYLYNTMSQCCAAFGFGCG